MTNLQTMKSLTRNTATLRNEIAKHLAADAVIQGDYWQDCNYKGCFLGCLSHSSSRHQAISLIQECYGLPAPLLGIAEIIFERLDPEESKAFFASFPDAVNQDNKDLSLVHWAFLAETLRRLPPQLTDLQKIIDDVINGMDLLASGDEWPAAAEAAARAAARAAEAAARAAAWAAMAARDAAMAADSAEIRHQRDSLLKLIKDAPICNNSQFI